MSWGFNGLFASVRELIMSTVLDMRREVEKIPEPRLWIERVGGFLSEGSRVRVCFNMVLAIVPMFLTCLTAQAAHFVHFGRQLVLVRAQAALSQLEGDDPECVILLP